MLAGDGDDVESAEGEEAPEPEVKKVKAGKKGEAWTGVRNHTGIKYHRITGQYPTVLRFPPPAKRAWQFAIGVLFLAIVISRLISMHGAWRR